MSISMGRVTHAVTFDRGIRDADWTDKPVGHSLGGTQQTLLPGGTTVSEALENVFPKEPTVEGLIARLLAEAGSAMSLRTAHGYRMAAQNTLKKLRSGKSKKARAAADEIESLLADSDLLDRYRAALLET